MYQEKLENMESKLQSLSLDRKFIMFENKSNNCWLDASMALVAHNKVLRIMVGCNPSSKLYDIVYKYDEAIVILNDNSNLNFESRIKLAKEKLQSLQNHTLEYLQPMLKCQNGEPDSAFCALLSLIYENKSIKESLSITWLWRKKCLKCNTSKLTQSSKPIVTLSKVNYFTPDCPASVYVCSCKTEQEMKLIYKELPPCLFFHFENGAGKGDGPPLFFCIQDRKYQLTGIITLEKGEESSVNHFITWIRDPKSNNWLECNDLNSDIVSYTSEVPLIDLNDVYMYVYESLDKAGKISIEISADYAKEQDFGNTNVELIDLSDESEDAKPDEVSQSEENAENCIESVANGPLDSFSKQSPVVPDKEEKIDPVQKKPFKELHVSEEEKNRETNTGLGTLKETVTQELNTPDIEKITNTLNTSIKQSPTKDIDGSAGKSKDRKFLSISNAGQKKLPVSSTNVPAEVDNAKTLPSEVDKKSKPKIDYAKATDKNASVKTVSSKVDEETKPKVDYAKAIVKNVRFLYQSETPKFSGASYKNKFIKKGLSPSALLQKKESEKLSKRLKLTEVKDSNQIASSNDKSQSASDIDASHKKNTVANLLEQNEAVGKAPFVSYIKNSSLKSDNNEKLDNRKNNTYSKNVLIMDKKEDSSLVVDNHNLVVGKKSIVKKEKLSYTCSETNKDDEIISKVHGEHLDAFPKIFKNPETFQNDASAEKTNSFKMHGTFSIFSKGINKPERFQNNKSDMQVEETSNSPSVKSSNESKRKHLSQQDMGGDENFVVPTKMCKISETATIDKNGSRGLTESHEKKQRISSRIPTKNKKYMTDYFDVSMIPLPAERKKNANVNRVTAVRDMVKPKNKMVLQKQSRKNAIKVGGMKLTERQLEELVDSHVDRAFAAFMEQVVHRHNILL